MNCPMFIQCGIVLLFFNLRAISARTGISVSGNQVFLNGESFFVKGVSYSPVPLNKSAVWDPPYGDYFTTEYLPLWQRDFKAIKEMNANVVRIYGWNNSANHSLFFDTLQDYGLKAIVTYYIGTAEVTPVDSEKQRQTIIDSFASEVKKYLGHPAILGWTFGNEFNNNWQNFLNNLGNSFNCGWNNNNSPLGCWDYELPFGSCPKAIECVYRQLFGLLNNASIAAHSLMDMDSYHLILSSLADVDQMISRIQSYGHYASDIDAWGLQVYRGKDFGQGSTDILSTFPTINGKPFLITEFGVDAYNDPCGHCTPLSCLSPCYNDENSFDNGYGEDQDTHSEWNIALASLLIDHRGQGSNGGCLMAWVDEYWKNGVDGIIWGCHPPRGNSNFAESNCQWKGHVDCPSQNISQHSLCGYWIGSSYDHYVNEAWFGINAVKKGQKPGSIDELVPRKLYFALKDLWASIPDTFENTD